MTPDEYGTAFSADLAAYSNRSPRSAQKDAGLIGASDFDCRERTRGVMLQLPDTDTPNKWAAFVGSALDTRLQEVRKTLNPRLLFDMEWPIILNGYAFTVHPDEVDPDEPSVTDYKTKNGLALVRSHLTDDPQRIQRHLQYEAGRQNGYLPDEGIVRNVYVDRSGKDPSVHIEQEPFSPEVVAQAASWLADVLYAVENNETASQDRPRDWCRQWCPAFTRCRGDEIEHPVLQGDTALLVEAYHTNHGIIAEAKQLEDEIKAELVGVTGVTPSGIVAVTTNVNAKAGPYTKFSTRRSA